MVIIRLKWLTNQSTIGTLSCGLSIKTVHCIGIWCDWRKKKESILSRWTWHSMTSIQLNRHSFASFIQFLAVSERFWWCLFLLPALSDRVFDCKICLNFFFSCHYTQANMWWVVVQFAQSCYWNSVGAQDIPSNRSSYKWLLFLWKVKHVLIFKHHEIR